MAKKGKKKATKGKKKIPLLAAGGLAVGGYYGFNYAKAALESGNTAGVVAMLSGYDMNNKNFRADIALPLYAPIIVGALGSKLMSELGVNRMLQGIPWIKL